MTLLMVAFMLDAVLGDPVYAWHPARVLGAVIKKAEAGLRARFLNLKLAGAILALSLPVTVFILLRCVLGYLERRHAALGFIVSLYFVYSSLSVRDLANEAGRVLQDLKMNDTVLARRDLSRIVGRDTHSLSPQEIVRGTVEAVSESTVDGIIAPLFYAALGGAPLAVAYKTVNTLDSMIGHKNDRYREFGFFAAKQDEIWNYLPARISLLIISIVSAVKGYRFREAFRAGWNHGVTGRDGNGSIPEAAFAGALGIRLGGMSTYEGRVVRKSELGFGNGELDTECIRRSLDLMWAAAWGGLLFVLVLPRIV